MGIGTFGSFTQARLAIYAAQAGISTTGNNISNVNTPGYTRQKVNQSSLYLGGTDRYYASSQVRIGGGVLVDSVTRMRDPYLDIRYRNQNSNAGAEDAWLGGLQEIAAILDEVGKGEINEGKDFGIVAAQFEKIYEALKGLTDQTGHDEYDNQVKTACSIFATEISSYAKRLESLRGETELALQHDVDHVNTLLTGIRDLNEQIRTAEIYNDNALELRDERDRQLDELSEYMKINVTYTEEHIGLGITVEKMTLRLGDANPDPKSLTDETVLIDGIYGSQISLDQIPRLNPKNAYANKILDAGGNIIGYTNETDPTALTFTENQDGTFTVSDGSGELFTLTAKDAAEAGITIAAKTAQEMGDPPYTSTDRFLNSKDEPVGDIKDAFMEYSPTYGITVSQLKDGKGALRMNPAGTAVNTAPVRLADNDIRGAIQSERELLTESGEFTNVDTVQNVDPNAASKRGIPYYQRALDILAKNFAEAMNNANTVYYTDKDGNYIETEVDAEGKVVAKLNADGSFNVLVTPADVANRPKGMTVNEFLATNPKLIPANKNEPLFSNNGTGNDATGITASNISISLAWSQKAMIVTGSVCAPGFKEPASTDSQNVIERMTSFFYEKQQFNAHDINPDAADKTMFEGTFEEFWNNMGTLLGEDQKVTGTLLDTYYESSIQIDTSRDSVSAVDFNDEAMNLMMYSKAYNAACRLMTTLDSVLDKLVNGTGVTT